MDLLRQVIPLHKELADRGQDRALDDAVLSSDLAAAVGQTAGPAGDARGRAAAASRRLSRRRRGADSPGRRISRRACSARSRAACGLRKARWPRRSSRRSPPPGIEWIATDEEILSHSTDGWVSRDGQGFLRNPEMLYRPWRVEDKGRSVQMVFRDHAMSDQIGFHYQRHVGRSTPSTTLLGKLEAIGRATTANAGKRPTLVSIILDGENCWEYYPNSGVDFLRSFIAAWSSIREITPTRICDYLDQLSGRPTKSARCSPAVGFSTISAFGSAIPSAIGPGIWCIETREHLQSPPRGRRLEDGRSTGPGPPRIVHRRGERLVLVVRRQPPSAPSKTCSTSCSASICKMSTRCSAIRFRPSCLQSIRMAPGAAAAVYRADGPAEREDRRPVRRISNG